jgi:hypothetical protein
MPSVDALADRSRYRSGGPTVEQAMHAYARRWQGLIHGNRPRRSAGRAPRPSTSSRTPGSRRSRSTTGSRAGSGSRTSSTDPGESDEPAGGRHPHELTREAARLARISDRALREARLLRERRAARLRADGVSEELIAEVLADADRGIARLSWIASRDALSVDLEAA